MKSGSLHTRFVVPASLVFVVLMSAGLVAYRHSQSQASTDCTIPSGAPSDYTCPRSSGSASSSSSSSPATTPPTSATPSIAPSDSNPDPVTSPSATASSSSNPQATPSDTNPDPVTSPSATANTSSAPQTTSRPTSAPTSVVSNGVIKATTKPTSAPAATQSSVVMPSLAATTSAIPLVTDEQPAINTADFSDQKTTNPEIVARQLSALQATATGLTSQTILRRYAPLVLAGELSPRALAKFIAAAEAVPHRRIAQNPVTQIYDNMIFYAATAGRLR